MDRIITKFARRSALGLLPLLLMGPGCSRLKSYRSQDSPLPAIPMLGRANRGPSSAMASRGDPVVKPDVAWSGPPNTAPPVARLHAPKSPAPGSVAPAPFSASADRREPAKPAGPSVATIHSLIASGRESLDKTRTYRVAMNRQERVGGDLQPAEDLMLSVRREPKAILLEWGEGPHKGREVLYSAAEHGGMIHINMADSMLPIPRMSLPPDSPMVMRNSRHPITEAGLDAILDKLDASLKAYEAGTAGGERLAYEGTVTPPEVGRPCHKITRKTARGESWIIYLDAGSCLPNFVQETAADGQLLERYAFRDLVAEPPALADAGAFDPDRRWGATRGLFGRVVRGNAPANPTTR